jgi:hypothetical protein
MFFVLKFELILIIGSNTVLSEGARKVYRGRRVGQGWSRQCGILNISQASTACYGNSFTFLNVQNKHISQLLTAVL